MKTGIKKNFAVLTLLAFGLAAAGISTPATADNNFRQHHPRRAEVLRRDARLNHALATDHGHLNGQYRKLERADHSIRRQEQTVARMNGGYITRGEQRHFNHEENRLARQTRNDVR